MPLQLIRALHVKERLQIILLFISCLLDGGGEGSDRECPELGPGEVTNEIHEAATSRK